MIGVLPGLSKAGRALHAWCVDRLDNLLDPDGPTYKAAYTLLHPHLLAYALYLQATNRNRTRSNR